MPDSNGTRAGCFGGHTTSAFVDARRIVALAAALLCGALSALAEDDPIRAALAEPARVRWDAAESALHVVYGTERLFDGLVRVREVGAGDARPARAGEVLFTQAGPGEGAIEQRWRLALALGAGLEELVLAGDVLGSDEALAAETRSPAQQRFPLVRTALGQSFNLRNDAVYDRRWDWLFSGPGDGATRIVPQARQAGSTRFAWESRGESVELVFRPLYYAQHRKLEHFQPWRARAWKDPVGGWCSWWAYRDGFDQKQLEEVVAALSAQHMADFGCRTIQIDDTFQTGKGLPQGWLEWNAQKFPAGAAGAVERIRAGGFEPGIWVYSSFDEAGVVAEHPDWFARDAQQKPIKGPWVNYGVDANRTAAIDALVRPTYRGLKKLGFGYVKVDSLRHLLYDVYQQPGCSVASGDSTPAGTFRKYLGAVRAELGVGTYVLACWGVLPEAIGIADGCRLGGDGFGPATLQQYNSWNGLVWRNDPDHCDLVPGWKDVRGREEAALAAARKDSVWRPCLVSMAGGALMLSDRAEVYADARNLEGAKRALPVLVTVPGQLYDFDPRKTDKLAAMERGAITAGADPSPIDAEQQGALAPWWLMEIDRPFERWNVLARFDAAGSGAPAASVRFDDLGLDPSREYLVWEFWSRSFVGSARGSFVAPALERSGTQVFALRAKLDRPQLLSTSRHISQGAAELKELTWNEGKQTLEGVSRLVAGDPYEIAVHVPAGWKALTARIGVAAVTPATEGEIVRFALTPAITEPVFWTISFQKP